MASSHVQIRSIDGQEKACEWDSMPFSCPASGKWAIMPAHLGPHMIKRFPPRAVEEGQPEQEQIEVREYHGPVVLAGTASAKQSCFWEGCDFTSDDPVVMKKHVLEHAAAEAEAAPKQGIGAFSKLQAENRKLAAELAARQALAPQQRPTPDDIP